jgi:AhpD family alkylhydroperoxidase
VQQVEAYIQQSGLEKSLIELVKMRASQINGCAYCLDVTARTRAVGAKPSSGSIFSTPGTNHQFTQSASGRLWPGPKP